MISNAEPPLTSISYVKTSVHRGHCSLLRRPCDNLEYLVHISVETYLEIMGPTLEKHAARENVMSDIAAYTAWAAYRL